MTSKMWSRHPASIILQWYAFAEKDHEGYASLSLLLECLENKCGIKSRVFLERISSKKWQESYGWRLKFHPWKPNRVKLIHGDDCKLGRRGKSPLQLCTSIPLKSGLTAGRRPSLLRAAGSLYMSHMRKPRKRKELSSHWFLKRQRKVEVGTGPTQLSSSLNSRLYCKGA